ncbi:MAG: hypothetical protein GY940_21405 [bacterium]|nr:hypothetical protein [bacterium]
MGNREDYEKKLETISAIETDHVTLPHHIPMDTYIQEADALYYWSREDREALTGAGLSGDLLEDLPVRSGALREAELLWYVRKNTGKEAARKWGEEGPKAHRLRQELITAFRFAFRKHPRLLEGVKHTAKGKGHPTMIQSLNDLSGFGKKNKPLLEAVGFDMTLLDKAAQTSKEMTPLLAESSVLREQYDKAKKIRDQAYTHLKEAVDEIREYGRFVFRENKERRIGYRSHYLRKINMRARSRSASVSPPVSKPATPDSTPPKTD